ncbi:MAG: O-antigen ligase family protein [Acidobacteriota bacterium]
MGFIVVLPALYAAWIAFRRSPAIAFVDVYIPVMLLLPEYYQWILPVLPDPTFSQAAIIPVALLFLSREFRNWKYSLMDFFILAFAFTVGLSEYTNTGFSEAQNLMFDMVGSVVLPYIAAKGLIEPKGLRVRFARRFASVLFAVSVISVFEFKMGTTPWQLLMNRFFPGQGDGWITTFRYGFARIAGPYGHAILACLIITVGFRIQRWLEWSGYWEPRFRHLPWLGISKARVMTFALLGGMVMTLVRGPWLGGFAGAVVTGVGLAKNRKMALLTIAGCLLVAGVPAGVKFYSYASVGRAAAKTDSQETAAYRKELLDKYADIAMEHAALGWGRNAWPKVTGMPSIDNYYLLLALMHGFIADGLMIAMILLMPFRLIRFELRRPAPAIRGSSLGFTLAGIYVAFGVTIATVYLGLTAVPVFAVMTGWAEGYLLSSGASQVVSGALPVAAHRKFAFRRVMA